MEGETKRGWKEGDWEKVRTPAIRTPFWFSDYANDYANVLMWKSSVCSLFNIDNISRRRNSFGLSLHCVYKMNTDISVAKVKARTQDVLRANLCCHSDVSRITYHARILCVLCMFKILFKNEYGLAALLKTKYIKKRAKNIPQ